MSRSILLLPLPPRNGLDARLPELATSLRSLIDDKQAVVHWATSAGRSNAQLARRLGRLLDDSDRSTFRELGELGPEAAVATKLAGFRLAVMHLLSVASEGQTGCILVPGKTARRVAAETASALGWRGDKINEIYNRAHPAKSFRLTVEPTADAFDVTAIKEVGWMRH